LKYLKSRVLKRKMQALFDQDQASDASIGTVVELEENILYWNN